MSHMIKKTDLILILILMVFAALAVFWFTGRKEDGKKVVVRQGTEIIGTYPLDEDLELEIQGKNGGSNLLVIQDGFACVSEANCPDRICVLTGAIRDTNELICCLPNELIIQIEE